MHAQPSGRASESIAGRREQLLLSAFYCSAPLMLLSPQLLSFRTPPEAVDQRAAMNGGSGEASQPRPIPSRFGGRPPIRRNVDCRCSATKEGATDWRGLVESRMESDGCGVRRRRLHATAAGPRHRIHCPRKRLRPPVSLRIFVVTGVLPPRPSVCHRGREARATTIDGTRRRARE
jgi:hypothetical protein